MLFIRKIKSTHQGGSVALSIVILLLVLILAGFVGLRVLNIPSSDSSKSQKLQHDPSGPSFVFFAAGDFSDNQNADQVFRKMGEMGSDFVLALGDLSYGAKGNEGAWCDFVKQRVSPDTPLQLIVGNHDDGGGDIADIRNFTPCLPDRMNSTGDYGIEYYFDRDNLARFIMISPDIDNYGYDYSEGSEHYNWVASVIDDARAEGLEWVILGMHKNCITPGVKSCEIGEDIMNLALERRVDLILQGHEHAFFRSKQLVSGTVPCEYLYQNELNKGCIAAEGHSFLGGAGSVIVIAGSGGHEIRDANLQDAEIGYFDAIDGANTGKVYGFESFSVNKHSINARFIPATEGDFSDSFEIVKR